MIGFTQAVALAYTQYFTFSGRSSRAELWWFVLFFYPALFVIGFVDGLMGTTIYVLGPDGTGFFATLFLFAGLIPGSALGCRRLHDTNKTGWWQFLYLVPFGGLVLVVWLSTLGDKGANRYGGNNLRSVGSTSRFCPKCSTAVPSGSSFCTLCGHMIETSKKTSQRT